MSPRPERPEVAGPLPGDPAPDATLEQITGAPFRLSSAWSGGPAVLAFLRYFGCPFCQAQVAQLKRDRVAFTARGCRIVLVGQGARAEASRAPAVRDMPFPLLLDRDRSVFRAYGLHRGRLGQIFSPAVAMPFVAANLRKQTRQRGLFGGEFMQMPGTFVVDPAGSLILAHRNRHIADSPSSDQLLAVIDRAVSARPRRRDDGLRRPVHADHGRRGAR